METQQVNKFLGFLESIIPIGYESSTIQIYEVKSTNHLQWWKKLCYGSLFEGKFTYWN